MFDLIAIPFGFLLKVIYEGLNSYGLAIIVFTILSKALVYPLTLKSKDSMRQTQKLQPQLKEIQKKYANNKQKIQEETARVYQEANINPLGSCLPTLLTLPIMIGLYYVIQQPMTYMMGISSETISALAELAGLEYTSTTARLVETQIADYVTKNFSTVSHLSENLMAIDFNFFGINLAQNPSNAGVSPLLLIPVVSAVTANISMTLTQKIQGIDTSEQPGALKGMMLTMPLMSAYFAYILPAGLGIYWITGNVITVVQEYFMQKQIVRNEAVEEEKIRLEKELEETNRRKEIELKKEEQRRISKENNEKKDKK